jgi:hypothetical protein
MIPSALALGAVATSATVACFRKPLLSAIMLAGAAAGTWRLVPPTARWLVLLYPILLVALFACRWRRTSRRTFGALAAVCVVGTWGAVFGPFVPRWAEMQRLAAEYPAVPLRSRLAYESRSSFRNSDRVPPSRDGELIDGIDRETAERYWSLGALEELHGDFFKAFAARNGFGSERMWIDPPKAELIELPSPAGPITLAVSSSVTSAGEVVESTSGASEALSDFHREQSLNFTNPRGFGFVFGGRLVPEETPYEAIGRMYVYRGATHVRGFQPHAFREPPRTPPGDEWQLTNLELVGLLKHDPPAVYVSDHLPRMQDLSSEAATTRPLDAFETESLKRLLDGEAVVAGQGKSRLRVLGGLRAAWQCTQCHSVGEGHLLGAFSYEFRRKISPAPEPRRAPKPVL